MLKRRLIPKLLLKKNERNRLEVVTTNKFDKIFGVGDPISQGKIYQAQFADELCVLSLDQLMASDRDLMITIMRKFSSEIFMPLTVGGGVRTPQDLRLLLTNGADKISSNSAAVTNPEFISEAARTFGAQCVVLSIDYKKNSVGHYRVYTDRGTRETGLDPLDWAIQGEKRGAGEILLTSIDHDGEQDGLDLDMIGKVASSVSIPVIASGGCGLAKHFIDAFLIGQADAVAAGTFFAFRDQNPMQTRSHIKNAGIPVRLQL